MRAAFYTLAAAAVLALAAAPVQAQVLDFEDLAGTHASSVPAGYGGLNWTNFAVYERGRIPGSGYENLDGGVGIINPGGRLAVTLRAAPFDFYSAMIGAAWNNGLTVSVVGLLGGMTVFNAALIVDTNSAPTHIFNWTNIDELRFTAAGGVNAGLGGVGTHFIMDNMTFGQQQVVPEPMTMVLLGTGLAGLAVARRRRGLQLEA